MYKRQVRTRDYEAMAEVIEFGARVVDQIKEDNVRKRFTLGLGEVAFALSRQRSDPRSEVAKTLLQNWGESEDKYKRHAGAMILAKNASFESRHADAARWYETAAASYEISDAKQDAQAKDNLLIRAGRHWRMAGDIKKAKIVLESVDLSGDERTLNRGYRDVELGICLQELGERDRAVKVWLAAAEAVPTLVQNSDVAKRLKAAGGVPLRPECDIEVQYLPPYKNQTVFGVTLATTGRRVFGITRHRANQILAFDLDTKKWDDVSSARTACACSMIANSKTALSLGVKRVNIAASFVFGSD